MFYRLFKKPIYNFKIAKHIENEREFPQGYSTTTPPQQVLYGKNCHIPFKIRIKIIEKIKTLLLL